MYVVQCQRKTVICFYCYYSLVVSGVLILWFMINSYQFNIYHILNCS